MNTDKQETISAMLEALRDQGADLDLISRVAAQMGARTDAHIDTSTLGDEGDHGEGRGATTPGTGANRRSWCVTSRPCHAA